ncbi:MAG TPA: hypothetical protein VNO24_06585 [Blastocatellia bacterium]|nr:hypothetical protein [Blastocatellia bacterium]
MLDPRSGAYKHILTGVLNGWKCGVMWMESAAVCGWNLRRCIDLIVDYL